MGRERTNSSKETVEKGQLRSDGECENVTSPFVILVITGFGDSWGEVQGTIAAGREENQHVYFQGYQHDRGPTGSLKWHCWKVWRHETTHFREVLARDVSRPLKVGEELFASP